MQNPEGYDRKQKKRWLPALVAILLVLIAAGVAAALLLRRTPAQPEPEPVPVFEPEVEPEPEPEPQPEYPKFSDKYPTDALFITEERKTFADGDLHLEIPRLDLSCPVLDGTTQEVFSRGVGLFEVSQLPEGENENVSIAAHRDIEGAEFYFIDTITGGDRIYLTYDGLRYTYEYEFTEIVEDDDWTLFYCFDYARVTLMSCHPIGTTEQRMIVVGKLIEISGAEERPETDPASPEQTPSDAEGHDAE